MTEKTTRTDVYNIVKPIEDANMYRLRSADFIYWVKCCNEGMTPEQAFTHPYDNNY